MNDIDLEKFNIDDKNMLIEDLNKITHNYDKYIDDNIVFDNSQTGIEQILSYLGSK